MTTFRALARPARWEQEIRRSRFIGEAYLVPDEATAAATIHEVEAEYPDASHVCYGGVIGGGRQPGPPRERFRDAGEPSGTAGRPILAVIRRQGLVETLVVVVRYFGGIRLGAAGLVRAYSSTAAGALAAAGVAEYGLWHRWQVAVPHNLQGLLRPLLVAGGVEWEQDRYAEEVIWQLLVPPQNAPALRASLVERSAGQVQVRELGEIWRPLAPDGNR